jgi:hypothetical protein
LCSSLLFHIKVVYPPRFIKVNEHEGGKNEKTRLQIAMDAVVERFERRDIQQAHAAPLRRLPQRASRQARNAANVLPEPVGARMSVFCLAAMAGQSSRCGAVGSPSAMRNQRCTASSSGTG